MSGFDDDDCVHRREPRPVREQRRVRAAQSFLRLTTNTSSQLANPEALNGTVEHGGPCFETIDRNMTACGSCPGVDVSKGVSSRAITEMYALAEHTPLDNV